MGSINILQRRSAVRLCFFRRLPYPYAPLYLYLAVLFFYGAGISGLVGWWARTRFGTRGTLIFLIALPLWGILRDFGGTSAVDQSQELIVWGQGITPVMADFTLWLIMGAAGFYTLYALEKWSEKK